MKKFSLFLLMFFSIFVLFAQETPNAEAANEVKEETKAEPAAETQTAAAPEAEQPADTPAAVKEEPKEETSPEAAAEAKEPAETVGQEAQNQEEQVQAAAETTDSREEQKEAEPSDGTKKEKKKAKTPKIKYERPYLGIGIPFVVLGSLSAAVLMPAMGAMAVAASDVCNTDENKDGEFCKKCRTDNHTAWTVGAVMTGVVGAGMIITGSWLISVKRPRQNQNVELNNVAILPTKDGMFASVGLNF